ncbi:hypothetical protein EDEG_00929 [Edhazardia aedis USNM 41457]|uniref:Uncharacterized protein n=1 Tax=Edhazardia aedis (strain USNM 41457) TaxID=1003232 RepID=J9DAY7_EDHAE|nr:hypothetical protein EDEG_00929 [Edhazardia aedis USNM 41457]|eukprot:EJW04936.1 hypothetical protein EDEG_00929 [Edhazardia aedis USNM 41457]
MCSDCTLLCNKCVHNNETRHKNEIDRSVVSSQNEKSQSSINNSFIFNNVIENKNLNHNFKEFECNRENQTLDILNLSFLIFMNTKKYVCEYLSPTYDGNIDYIECIIKRLTLLLTDDIDSFQKPDKYSLFFANDRIKLFSLPVFGMETDISIPYLVGLSENNIKSKNKARKNMLKNLVDIVECFEINEFINSIRTFSKNMKFIHTIVNKSLNRGISIFFKEFYNINSTNMFTGDETSEIFHQKSFLNTDLTQNGIFSLKHITSIREMEHECGSKETDSQKINSIDHQGNYLSELVLKNTIRSLINEFLEFVSENKCIYHKIIYEKSYRNFNYSLEKVNNSRIFSSEKNKSSIYDDNLSYGSADSDIQSLLNLKYKNADEQSVIIKHRNSEKMLLSTDKSYKCCCFERTAYSKFICSLEKLSSCNFDDISYQKTFGNIISPKERVFCSYLENEKIIDEINRIMFYDVNRIFFEKNLISLIQFSRIMFILGEEDENLFDAKNQNDLFSILNFASKISNCNVLSQYNGFLNHHSNYIFSNWNDVIIDKTFFSNCEINKKLLFVHNVRHRIIQSCSFIFKKIINRTELDYKKLSSQGMLKKIFEGVFMKKTHIDNNKQQQNILLKFNNENYIDKYEENYSKDVYMHEYYTKNLEISQSILNLNLDSISYFNDIYKCVKNDNSDTINLIFKKIQTYKTTLKSFLVCMKGLISSYDVLFDKKYITKEVFELLKYFKSSDLQIKSFNVFFNQLILELNNFISKINVLIKFTAHPSYNIDYIELFDNSFTSILYNEENYIEKDKFCANHKFISKQNNKKFCFGCLTENNEIDFGLYQPIFMQFFIKAHNNNLDCLPYSKICAAGSNQDLFYLNPDLFVLEKFNYDVVLLIKFIVQIFVHHGLFNLLNYENNSLIQCLHKEICFILNNSEFYLNIPAIVNQFVLLTDIMCEEILPFIDLDNIFDKFEKIITIVDSLGIFYKPLKFFENTLVKHDNSSGSYMQNCESHKCTIFCNSNAVHLYKSNATNVKYTNVSKNFIDKLNTSKTSNQGSSNLAESLINTSNYKDNIIGVTKKNMNNLNNFSKNLTCDHFIEYFHFKLCDNPMKIKKNDIFDRIYIDKIYFIKRIEKTLLSYFYFFKKILTIGYVYLSKSHEKRIIFLINRIYKILFNDNIKKKQAIPINKNFERDNLIGSNFPPDIFPNESEIYKYNNEKSNLTDGLILPQSLCSKSINEVHKKFLCAKNYQYDDETTNCNQKCDFHNFIFNIFSEMFFFNAEPYYFSSNEKMDATKKDFIHFYRCYIKKNRFQEKKDSPLCEIGDIILRTEEKNYLELVSMFDSDDVMNRKEFIDHLFNSGKFATLVAQQGNSESGFNYVKNCFLSIFKRMQTTFTNYRRFCWLSYDYSLIAKIFIHEIIKKQSNSYIFSNTNNLKNNSYDNQYQINNNENKKSSKITEQKKHNHTSKFDKFSKDSENHFLKYLYSNFDFNENSLAHKSSPSDYLQNFFLNIFMVLFENLDETYEKTLIQIVKSLFFYQHKKSSINYPFLIHQDRKLKIPIYIFNRAADDLSLFGPLYYVNYREKLLLDRNISFDLKEQVMQKKPSDKKIMNNCNNFYHPIDGTISSTFIGKKNQHKSNEFNQIMMFMKQFKGIDFDDNLFLTNKIYNIINNRIFKYRKEYLYMLKLITENLLTFPFYIKICTCCEKKLVINDDYYNRYSSILFKESNICTYIKKNACLKANNLLPEKCGNDTMIRNILRKNSDFPFLKNVTSLEKNIFHSSLNSENFDYFDAVKNNSTQHNQNFNIQSENSFSSKDCIYSEKFTKINAFKFFEEGIKTKNIINNYENLIDNIFLKDNILTIKSFKKKYEKERKFDLNIKHESSSLDHCILSNVSEKRKNNPVFIIDFFSTNTEKTKRIKYRNCYYHKKILAKVSIMMITVKRKFIL